MAPTNLPALTWRKSSRSGSGVNCVEVAFAPDAIAVRDSKDPYGPTLVVSPAGFARFLNSLR
jgi:hypothetical protein